MNLLPVRSNLIGREMDMDHVFSRCVSTPETMHHTLLACHVLKHLWFSCSLGIIVDHVTSMEDFMFDFYLWLTLIVHVFFYPHCIPFGRTGTQFYFIVSLKLSWMLSNLLIGTFHRFGHDLP